MCAHARTQTHAKLHPVQKIARFNVTELCPIQLQLMLLSYSLTKSHQTQLSDVLRNRSPQRL